MPPLYSMPSAKTRHNHAGTTDERTQPISDHSEAAKHPQEAWRLERGCRDIHQSMERCLFSQVLVVVLQQFLIPLLLDIRKRQYKRVGTVEMSVKNSEAVWWCERCIYDINSKQKHVMAKPHLWLQEVTKAWPIQDKSVCRKNKQQTAINIFLSYLYHGLSAQCCHLATKNIWLTEVYVILKNYCWDWLSTYAPPWWYATSIHDDT